MMIRVRVETPNCLLGKLMAMDIVGFYVAAIVYGGPPIVLGVFASNAGGGIVWAIAYVATSLFWIRFLWIRGYRVWVLAFAIFGPPVPLAVNSAIVALFMIPMILSPPVSPQKAAADAAQKIIESHKTALAVGSAYLPASGSTSCPTTFPVKVYDDYYLLPNASGYSRASVHVCYFSEQAARQYGFRSSPLNPR